MLLSKLSFGNSQVEVSPPGVVENSYIGKIKSGCGRWPSRALILRLAEVGDPDELLREAKREIRGLREQLDARGKAGWL